jgi:hypothetical protein
MTLHLARSILCAAGIAFALTAAFGSPAEAATSRKHKKRDAAVSQQVRPPGRPVYWGTDQVRRGPLYHGPEYLGDDPDPNIRFQILRDIDARYGGGGD